MGGRGGECSSGSSRDHIRSQWHAGVLSWMFVIDLEEDEPVRLHLMEALPQGSEGAKLPPSSALAGTSR